MTTKTRLLELVDRLRESLGEEGGPQIADPFEQILFEQVAYLASDEKRAAAFDLLRDRIGLSPRNILEAKDGDLLEVATAGGSAVAEKRASRMRDSARIVMQNWEGDLSGVLTLSHERARKILSCFAMIGEPGADKILLFAGASKRLALDSNGLRVLQRVGYGTEEDQYARAYRSVIEDAEPELDGSWESAYAAHVQLKRLGREVCRRSTPRCEVCPLNHTCNYYRRGSPQT